MPYMHAHIREKVGRSWPAASRTPRFCRARSVGERDNTLTLPRTAPRAQLTVGAMLTIEARKPPPDQETLRLEVSPEDSVAALKIRIATQRDGWSANQMNIILQGAFLQDSKTVAECGLKDGDFVVITGMVSRDMRRPTGEAEGPLREMPDEMSPLFPASCPPPSELPTEQRIERT